MTQTSHAVAMCRACCRPPSKTWPTEQPRSDMRRIIAWGCVLLVLQFCGFGLWATTVPLRGAVVAPGIHQGPFEAQGGATSRRRNHQVDLCPGERSRRSRPTHCTARHQRRSRRALVPSKPSYLLIWRWRPGWRRSKTLRSQSRFPDELRESATRLSAHIAIQTQEAEFAARLAAIENERKVIDQQMLQNADAIRGLESNTQGLEQQLTLLREEIADTSYLLAKGLARKPRVLALKRAEAEAAGQVDRNAASISEMQGKIAELQDRRRQLGFNQNQDIAKQRHATSEEIGDLRHRIAALRAQLARSELRAPESGRIVGLNSRDLNAVLGPRETLLEIVPIQDRLVIEATLKPTDREEVYVGQMARVRVHALNIRRRPMLEGRVVGVAADALTDTQLRRELLSGRG